MRYSGDRTKGFTAVELVLVIVVLAILTGIVLVQVEKIRQARLREESAANLKTLSRVIRLQVRRDYPPAFPALSTTPGRLAPEPTDRLLYILQELATPAAFISPAHPRAKRLRKEARANPEAAITDDSYWYLGYALVNEEAGLAFVEAYKKAVEETGKPPTEDIELRSPTALRPLGRLGMTPYMHFRMEPGGDRIKRIPNVPVAIERPGLQRGGSNVLFWDGHVEFLPYPGPWPMTEKFIKALESLDELKESHVDTPKK